MSIQIKKKFIKSQIIDGTKVLFLNEDSFKALNSMGSEVELFKINSSDEFRFLQMPKVSSDPVSSEDISRKGYVDAEVLAEETRALAAEASLQSQIDTLETGVQDELDDTQVGAGLGADGSYTAPVVSNYLSSAVSLKDADSKLDTQVKTVADNLAQEVIDRVADVNAEESRALAAEAALDGRLDIVEGADTVEGSIAKAEKDAKDYTDAREVIITSAYQAYADQAEADAISSANSYTDAEIAALVDSAPAVLDTLNELAQALGADPNFATTVAGQIGDIESELDSTQIGAGLNGDGSYSAPAVSNYLSAVITLKDADSALDTQIKTVADDLAQEILDRIADVDAEETRALAAESVISGNLAQEILDRIADVDAEETRALAAESALDVRLDIIEGADTVEGSVAKAEKDAKDYTDAAITQEVIDRNSAISTAVSNLVDGAPALLDTLNELAAAINDDANFAATIASQLGSLDSRADALEVASVEFKPVEKFVLSATDISNGYITLSYLAIQHSLRVSVDRLAIHQGAGNDYTVSTVGGVTRLTFVNSLVTPGQEQLSVSDEVYVEGAKVAVV